MVSVNSGFRPVQYASLLECILVTGHNEVVAKVMFLQVSVIHSVHSGEGVCLSACWDTITPLDQADIPLDHVDTPWDQAGTPPDQADPPPGPGRHPLGPGRHPQTRQAPPQTRQTHPTPQDQAGTPSTRHTPLWTRHAPPRKQTPAYGLPAAATHPTGMHSCYHCIWAKTP